MITIKNVNKARRLAALRNTQFGRLCVRVLGNERGAVMMEYVIISVLIAAAAVVAVAMFGKTIVGMFDTAAKGATGEHSAAATAREATVTEQGKSADEAKTYHDDMHE